ncbi:hypothetical protein ACIQF5_20765 [Streptomyces goshikiensis]|uniref:hypothetical protein n=1 Tax=Streptomyces goshikiensis TaxID=1942 RepID=UPI0038298B4A
MTRSASAEPGVAAKAGRPASVRWRATTQSSGRYDAAARLQNALGSVTDPAVRGWIGEQRAAYLHHGDAHIAQQPLSRALDDNPFVLKPIGGVTPAQLRPTAAQAEACAAYLKDTYADATAQLLGVQVLLQKLVWKDKDRADEAEQAWESLGRHLGFIGTRPEKLYDTGPDNLWILGPARSAVIELKPGCVTDTISKHDLDQLGGSVRWAAQTLPDVTQRIPVIVHPSREPHSQAITVEGTRVVTPAKWTELTAAVRFWAEALTRGQHRWQDPRPWPNSSRSTS